MREGLTHWLTLYPAALGLPFGLAAFLFNLPLLYFGLIGTLTISLASAIINVFFREDVIAGRYLERLARKLKEQEKQTLQRLAEDLQDCMKIPTCAAGAEQGLEQLKRLQGKYRNVQTVLQKKLKQGELTYGRFIGAAEQVYLSGLETLKQITVVLQSMGSIDPQYINRRLSELTMLESRTQEGHKEEETLRNRLRLMKEQQTKVDTLLAANEEAMTTLEETTAAIAAMNTSGKVTREEYDSAIRQLQEIAGKAHLYNKR